MRIEESEKMDGDDSCKPDFPLSSLGDFFSLLLQIDRRVNPEQYLCNDHEEDVVQWDGKTPNE